MTGGFLHGRRLKWREADWWGDELGEGRTGRRVIGMNLAGGILLGRILEWRGVGVAGGRLAEF